MTPTPAERIAEAHRFLAYIFRPGEIVELRAQVGDHMIAGRHNDLQRLAYNAVGMQEVHRASACYFTSNPVAPDSRIAKRSISNSVIADIRAAAGNGDISHRATLLIDVDPHRPSGVCSTQAEKSAAREVMDRTIAYLSSKAWPEPLLVDSGNGYHAYYLIDRRAPRMEAWEYLLKALGQMFDSLDAKIDTSVTNPGRIVRLPGTWNRKGEDTPERPHRLAHVISQPTEKRYVDHGSMILTLAREHGYVPRDEQQRTPRPELVIDEDGVLKLIAEYPTELDLAGTERRDGRTYFYLHHCPLAGRTHRDQGRKTAIILGETLGFSCFSDECCEASIGTLLRTLERRTGHRAETPIWHSDSWTWLNLLRFGLVEEAAEVAAEADDYDEDEWAMYAPDEEDEKTMTMETTTTAPEVVRELTPAERYDRETEALAATHWADEGLTLTPADWGLTAKDVWAAWYTLACDRLQAQPELSDRCKAIHAAMDVPAMAAMLGVDGLFRAARAKERAATYPGEEADRIATVAEAAIILRARISAPAARKIDQ